MQCSNFANPIIVYSENDLTNQTLPCNAIKLQLKSFLYLLKLINKASLIHLHEYTSWSALVLSLLGTFARIPVILDPHGNIPHRFSSLKIKIFHHLTKSFYFSIASRYIAEDKQAYLEFAKIGARTHQISTIFPAKDLDWLDKPCIDTKLLQPSILFLGRLHPIKNPLGLVKLYSQLVQYYPTLKCIFAGPDGGELAKIKEQLSKLGLLDKVSFKGYCDQAEMNELFSSNLFVYQASQYENAMSYVALEAASKGCLPIFSSNTNVFEDCRGYNYSLFIDDQLDSNLLGKFLSEEFILEQLSIFKGIVDEKFSIRTYSQELKKLYNKCV